MRSVEPATERRPVAGTAPRSSYWQARQGLHLASAPSRTAAVAARAVAPASQGDAERTAQEHSDHEAPSEHRGATTRRAGNPACGGLALGELPPASTAAAYVIPRHRTWEHERQGKTVARTHSTGPVNLSQPTWPWLRGSGLCDHPRSPTPRCARRRHAHECCRRSPTQGEGSCTSARGPQEPASGSTRDED